MENIADALKMAFGILVFAIAITILFMTVSKAKSTADVVLYYSDNTNFREEDSSSDKNRTVGVSEIISTLYRYYKESVAVTIVLEENNPEKTYKFDLGYETIFIKDGNGKDILSLGTEQNIEKNLGKFISDNLLGIDESTTFKEEFTEVPISGIYSTGSDGSEIVLSAGGKKVYITYTKV